ncbi:hypothetical protein [Nostoc sp. UHCC 0302]|uniref:hypothetical protein n=1 Tax=Nostoc sp. UHCC 0302 TaxID=3134896 RepID=UPI00311CDF90
MISLTIERHLTPVRSSGETSSGDALCETGGVSGAFALAIRKLANASCSTWGDPYSPSPKGDAKSERASYGRR